MAKSPPKSNPMQKKAASWLLHEPDDALIKILNATKAIKEVESIKLVDAADRVAANHVKSPLILPPVHRSERDGFALRAQDSGDGAVLKVVGAATAGSAFEGKVSKGQCIRIATGAVIPSGANAVVMFEEVGQNEEQIELATKIEPWDWVAKAGSDMRKGQRVISKGDVLTPPAISALSALGFETIEVTRKARALVFTTGNEVRKPGQDLGDADVYDGNTNGLVALLRQQGVDAKGRSTVRDTFKSMCSALEKAAADYDLIVFTGGTSVGDKDFGRSSLDQVGKTLVHGINLKPGKPLLFGMIGKCAVMGLPGFPTSAIMVAYHFLVPLADQLSGRLGAIENAIIAPLAHDIQPDPFKRFLLPVTFNDEGEVESVFKGSAAISSVGDASGYLVLDPSKKTLKAGSDVLVTLL